VGFLGRANPKTSYGQGSFGVRRFVHPTMIEPQTMGGKLRDFVRILCAGACPSETPSRGGWPPPPDASGTTGGPSASGRTLVVRDHSVTLAVTAPDARVRIAAVLRVRTLRLALALACARLRPAGAKVA
jgi:hypothetical protein